MYANSVAARLMSALGVLSLLAVVGLYSVLSYAVSERTQEIGIRMAVGAAPGLALGTVLGVGAAGFAQDMLAGVSPADPVALGGAVMVPSIVAAAAGLVPALRASPAEVLQSR